MERSSQNQSDVSSRSSTFPIEAKKVLQAALFLSISEHTGDPVPKGDECVQSEDVQASSLRAPARNLDPQLVLHVKALIDSTRQCRGLFEKGATQSDVMDQQNRLILAKEHVQEFVLPLLRAGNDLVSSVEIWCGKVYVLTSDWKAFVMENKLGVSDVLRI
ncbi:hypothetical protein ACJRO7_004665 [Eucalyptus globulus]|uniref:Uncharacterized protein n=1 Tax=Eucalyptus globulus TaxID=34317 RepID=A0ABD3J0N1_EUCGL